MGENIEFGDPKGGGKDGNSVPLTGISEIVVSSIGHFGGFFLYKEEPEKAVTFRDSYIEVVLPVLRDTLKCDEALGEIMGNQEAPSPGTVLGIGGGYLALGFLMAMLASNGEGPKKDEAK